MSSTKAERSSWKAVGSDATAQKTYASIKAALADLARERDLDIFLQGSYANHTNIRADSDVDVVVMTRQTYSVSTERLSASGQLSWSMRTRADYNSFDLRRDVEVALAKYYGSWRIHPKNKCIRVDKSEGYVDADVVPCIEYHWYRTPYAEMSSEFVEGVRIFPLQGPAIINYPKEHIRNGQIKNIACSDRYKPTVRQMKRLRNRAIAEGVLNHGEAPGYLLECMTYNAPTDRFVYDDSDRLLKVLSWLKYADKAQFYSCDRIHRLFIDDPGQYQVAKAQRIIDALWEAL